MAETKNKGKRNILRSLFTGNVLLSDFITKQWKYMLFLVVLALLYIWFHYNMADTVRAVRRMERDVRVLQVEYTTQQSLLMRMNKQSEVAKMLKERGITNIALPKTPPTRIKE